MLPHMCSHGGMPRGWSGWPGISASPGPLAIEAPPRSLAALNSVPRWCRLPYFLLSSFVRPHTHTVCPISHTMHSILVAGTPLRQPSSPITVHCSAALCTPLSLVPWDFVGIHDVVWLLPLARPPAGGSLRRLFCMRPAPPPDQAGVPLLLSFCCAPMMFVPTRVRRPSLLKMSAAATLQPASQFQSS